ILIKFRGVAGRAVPVRRSSATVPRMSKEKRVVTTVARWALPRSLEHRRDLLRELVVRDMKLRYNRSYLGIAWTLVNPLAQLLVYSFVFRVLFRVTTPNYTPYIFIGITCWG